MHAVLIAQGPVAYDAERLPGARYILETTDCNFEFETTDRPLDKRLLPRAEAGASA